MFRINSEKTRYDIIEDLKKTHKNVTLKKTKKNYVYFEVIKAMGK